MALMILTGIYFLVFFLCVVISVKQKINKINNDYLYIYLGIIFMIDISVLILQQIFKIDTSMIYIFSDIVNIFFTYLYFKIQIGSVRYIAEITIFAAACVFIVNDWEEWKYSDYCSIISCFYSIAVCLLGFYKILDTNFNSAKKIQNIPFFWYATAILLWSTAFLMRTIPRFYFQSVDDLFMEELRLFFAVINIITYLIFFMLLLRYNKNGKTTLFKQPD